MIMEMKNIKKIVVLLAAVLCFVLLGIPAVKSMAEVATAVSIGKIDYDRLTMQVNYNDNAIVYYSTDNNTWTELEGAYDSTTKSCVMDISWISGSNEVTLYFKGNTVKTVKSVTLPAQNTSFDVDYDKAEGIFTFSDTDDSDVFQWRKATDYNWITVNLDENSSSYNNFLEEMENFRLKGAKIYFRIPQTPGTGSADVGMRQSKEISVSIVARAAAPSVKVNASKLTLNTSASMEYYDQVTGLWIECSSNMSLDEIAPQVFYENGANAVTLQIRKAATTSAPYSKTAKITIPGQAAAPLIGDQSADVTHYIMNSKLILQFNKATTKNVYEYAIVKAGYSFDVSKASWRTAATSSIITLTSSSAPEGCTIYVRKKGTDASATASLDLSSAVNSFTVTY
jgi:hypothetical protein